MFSLMGTCHEIIAQSRRVELFRMGNFGGRLLYTNDRKIAQRTRGGVPIDSDYTPGIFVYSPATPDSPSQYYQLFINADDAQDEIDAVRHSLRVQNVSDVDIARLIPDATTIELVPNKTYHIAKLPEFSATLEDLILAAEKTKHPALIRQARLQAIQAFAVWATGDANGVINADVKPANTGIIDDNGHLLSVLFDTKPGATYTSYEALKHGHASWMMTFNDLGIPINNETIPEILNIIRNERIGVFQGDTNQTEIYRALRRIKDEQIVSLAEWNRFPDRPWSNNILTEVDATDAKVMEQVFAHAGKFVLQAVDSIGVAGDALMMAELAQTNEANMPVLGINPDQKSDPNPEAVLRGLERTSVDGLAMLWQMSEDAKERALASIRNHAPHQIDLVNNSIKASLEKNSAAIDYAMNALSLGDDHLRQDLLNTLIDDPTLYGPSRLMFDRIGNFNIFSMANVSYLTIGYTTGTLPDSQGINRKTIIWYLFDNPLTGNPLYPLFYDLQMDDGSWRRFVHPMQIAINYGVGRDNFDMHFDVPIDDHATDIRVTFLSPLSVQSEGVVKYIDIPATSLGLFISETSAEGSDK